MPLAVPHGMSRALFFLMTLTAGTLVAVVTRVSPGLRASSRPFSQGVRELINALPASGKGLPPFVDNVTRLTSEKGELSGLLRAGTAIWRRAP
jgi:hypothetical protein